MFYAQTNRISLENFLPKRKEDNFYDLSVHLKQNKVAEKKKY